MSKIINKLRDNAQNLPDNILLISHQSEITNLEIWNEVNRLSVILKGHIGDQNRPIAFLLDNGPEWVALDLALMLAQIPALPLPPFFTQEQINGALKDSGAIALINTESGEDFTIFGKNFKILPTGFPAVELHKGTAKITYTSGSTGAPKGVCLSLPQMETLAQSLVDTIGSEFAKIHLAVLPLGVLLENVAGLYPTILAGGKYAVNPLAEIGFANKFAPNIGDLIEKIRATKATSLILVPEILRLLIGAMMAGNIKLPTLEFVAVGGAKIPPELLHAAKDIGLNIYEGYGLSECSSVVALNTPKNNEIGSVGVLLPHLNATVGADGELIITHKTLENCFLGYVGGDKAPKELPTGDLARIEGDKIYIDGRKKNLIINSFGRNISPEWVEAQLLASPYIAQCFVYGDGEATLSALIVPANSAILPEQIASAVIKANANLPEYAQIIDYKVTTPFLPANGELTENGRLKREAIFARRFDGSSLRFYYQLVGETFADAGKLKKIPQIQAGIKGDISLETYIAYLTEAYHHVKHTVPLMEACKAKMPVEKSLFHEALDEYIEEEIGHENWILADIKHCGGDMLKAKNSPPNAPTELMVSFVYDFINRVNPAGFFGMVFVLEGTSVELATKGAKAVAKNLNLGEECFTYLTSHGDLDISHLGFFERLMNQVKDKQDQSDIIHVAKMVFKLFGEMFASIPLTNANTKELVDAI